jgi:hypothetical protein
MYRLINQNRDAVIAEFERIDKRRHDLSVYRQLREDLISGRIDVASDGEFQQRYRRYWGMRGWLSDAFVARYFELLAERTRSGESDVGTIVRDLSRPEPINDQAPVRKLANAEKAKKESLQFSFATKLAHMVNPRLPLYDSFVAAFYFHNRPSSGPGPKRLAALLAFHDFLRRESARVIRDGLLGGALQEFRAHFQISDAVCDERIVDWLVWAWVSLLRGGAQQRGEALYE